jgi:PAS domain S-box-containing protein
MDTSSIIKNKKNKSIFINNSFQPELNSILLFISELCDVSNIYLNIRDIEDNDKSNDYIIEGNSTIADNIPAIMNAIVQQNKANIISTVKKASEIKLEPLNNLGSTLVFFVEFQIINKYGAVIGSLCLINLHPQKLSPIQNKIISQSITNIQFLINSKNENNELQNALIEKETLFESHYENSTEIVYELDENGIITLLSKNWKTILGHEMTDVVGTNFNYFIHPEDEDNCMHAVKNLTARITSKEEVTYRIKHKNGNYVWHTATLKIVKKKKGFCFIGNCRDITEHVESKQKLNKQKEFYVKILDCLPTAVAVFDRNHKYIYSNTTSIKNNELRKFIIGKDDFDYAIHTGRDSMSANLRRIKFLEALESKELIEWEDEVTHSDGHVTVHKRKLNPVFLEDGTLEMMVGFGTDITESIKFQKQILESKQLVQEIIENVAVGIIVQGSAAEIITNNEAACEMLGLSQPQLLGKTSFDPNWKAINSGGKELKPEEQPILRAIKEGRPVEGAVMGVYHPIRNDLVWLLVDAIPVFNTDTSLQFVICSFNNITDQINAENDLRISNERFFYSNKASSDVIWDLNLATKKVFYGDGYFENYGVNLNNTLTNLGENYHLIHPLDKDKAYASMNLAILGTGDFWQYEYRHLKSDDTFAIVEDTAYIVRNEKGEAIRVIGAMKDITDKRKLEAELQQSEEQFKGAFLHSAAGMAIVSDEGYHIEVNAGLIKILGYTSSEMKSLKLEDLTHNADLQKYLIFKKKLDSHKISNFTIEIRFLRKDKTIVWINKSVSLLKKNKYYICQFIDISKRKKIEAENKLLVEENSKNKQVQLDEAQHLYRLLANNTVDIVCLHNNDTTFKYISPSITTLLGYTPEELIGHSPLDYANPVEVEDIKYKLYDFISDKLNDYESNRTFVPLTARFKHKNGVYIWLEITANLITENGVLMGIQTSSRDLTADKKAERALTKALLKERELNELRTNLVSTISHEFRTPMTTIRASTELISMYLEGQNIKNSSRLQKRVDIITQEIDRIVELMNAVLTLSKEDARKTTFFPTLFNLRTLCIETVDKNFTDLEDQGKVKTNSRGNNFMVYADRNLIEYCISNLLNNAFKYSKSFAEVELNIMSTESECEIQIIDCGIGIPKKDQDKLFNTFYRASNTSGIQGTGLGLYIVKTFVEKNKGKVTLESRIGKGTKVTVKFPLQKSEEDDQNIDNYDTRRNKP